MGNADFIEIGTEAPPWVIWCFVAIGAYGVFRALKPAKRASGIALAIGGLLIAATRFPMPWGGPLILAFYYVGAIADEFRTGKSTRLNLVLSIAWKVAFVGAFVFANVLCCMGRNISIRGDRLYSSLPRFGVRSTDKSHLALVDLLGWHGELVEWRFVTTRTDVKDPFIANPCEGLLYWNGGTRLLTSAEVANQISKWAGIKATTRTYEDYVYKGNKSLAKP